VGHHRLNVKSSKSSGLWKLFFNPHKLCKMSIAAALHYICICYCLVRHFTSVDCEHVKAIAINIIAAFR